MEDSLRAFVEIPLNLTVHTIRGERKNNEYTNPKTKVISASYDRGASN